MSAAGNVDGAWPWRPTYSTFGPFSRANARVPWSIPKRKSRRPCAMKTGVVTEPSFERLERAAAHGRTAALFPAKAAAWTASSAGSRLLGGIDPARPATSTRLDETLRHERGVEVGPRLHRDDRSPRHARDERVEDRAAAVGDAPGADLRIRDVRPRGEPVANGPRIGDLPRAVDPDEPAGLIRVPARRT